MREKTYSGSGAAATRRTASASSAVREKIEMQSSDRAAGTHRAALIRPREGLSPITLLNAAGTRPDPATSVPSAKATSPAETATPEPELDPPGT